jgi:pimeloyl-ACP methyl ester carboxylesterase
VPSLSPSSRRIAAAARSPARSSKSGICRVPRRDRARSSALLVALRRPELVRRVVLISGVFHRDGWIPEAIDPDAGPPEVLERGYAELSPDGPDHYPVVAAKLTRMNWEEPTLATSDLSGVTSRTLVMLGDDDEVTLEHAVEMYRGLPDAELAVMPGTSHGLLHEKPALCNAILVDFLTTDPLPTIAPVCRANGA